MHNIKIMTPKALLKTILLCLCTLTIANAHETNLKERPMNTYTQITQDEAMHMMTKNDGHIILDVRRPDEYAIGHIPGAILIPNETIGTTPPEELKDFDQIILVYCRSGNRSKQAASKLAAMGYSQIYEFGGINSWTGEITQD